MSEVTYYRIRQNFSSGMGDWVYHETDWPWDKDTVDDIAERSHNEYNWSEHYRGCDIEKVEFPPLKWVNASILDAQHRMQWAQARFERLRALRQTIENLPKQEEK